jgi:(S)-3,5-dihydroxyphenylglycine transaminase
MTADLKMTDLHGALQDPALTSMNFLNEVTSRYPDALSFAPGRPTEAYFDTEAPHRYLRTFCDYLGGERGLADHEIRRELFQYGRTKGIVHDLIAENLAVDEGIHLDPESIVVTVGCQEAMFLVLRALRADHRDVMLSVSPMYVGLTGAARLLDMPVIPVSGGPVGVDLDDLVARVREARAAGLRPRACYVMPDFANPSGVSLDEQTRRLLLDIAEREDILLIEDNPYGLFHDGSARPATLKANDTRRRVVYLGSFAKTVLPGARVGYVVADQRVEDSQGRETLLADLLAKVKSMITVNTSPIAQAVVGGKLLESGRGLARANARERDFYQRNMHRVRTGLATRFAGRDDVTWNSPTGGFFVVVTVPFPVDDEVLVHSAEQYGVLWTPMCHFFVGDGGGHQIRLSCSSLTPQQIDEGLARFARFVDDHA